MISARVYRVLVEQRLDDCQIVWNAVPVLGGQQSVAVDEPDGEFFHVSGVLSDRSQTVV